MRRWMVAVGRTSPSSEAWAGEAAATVTAATAAAFSTVDGRWGGRGGSGQRRGRWFARDLTRLRNVSRRRDSWMQDDSPGRSPWESSARAAAATFLAATVRFC